MSNLQPWLTYFRIDNDAVPHMPQLSLINSTQLSPYSVKSNTHDAQFVIFIVVKYQPNESIASDSIMQPQNYG